MKRKVNLIIIFLMVLVFLAGLGILLYPHINGAIIDDQLDSAAQDFIQREPSKDVNIPIPAARKYPDLWDAFVAYNEAIWDEKQAGLCDPWSYQQPSFSLSEYGIEDEVFGAISIPALDLKLPIYLGASDAHMSGGAAHLSQTSIPIGGCNTNSVIAGHRGWRGGSYFRYITDLKPGDEVIITNLWDTLVYRVTETQIIEPNDIEKILIQGGEDMITLVTCHPYSSGTHRYLVYCDRVS